MKAITKKMASGILVLSLMQTTLATVRADGIDRTETASPEVVQLLETNDAVNGQHGKQVTNVNNVVGGQGKNKVLGCGLCIFGSAVALTVAPPVGFVGALGCILLCGDAF